MGVDDVTTTGGSPKELEFQALDKSVDELRRKYGRAAITHGSDLLSGRTEFSEGLSEIMAKDNDRIPAFEETGPDYVIDEDVTQPEE